MYPSAYVVIFGSLALFVGSIIVGAVMEGPWGRGMLTVGIIGSVVWVVAAFTLARAMNTDI